MSGFIGKMDTGFNLVSIPIAIGISISMFIFLFRGADAQLRTLIFASLSLYVLGIVISTANWVTQDSVLSLSSIYQFLQIQIFGFFLNGNMFPNYIFLFTQTQLEHLTLLSFGYYIFASRKPKTSYDNQQHNFRFPPVMMPLQSESRSFTDELERIQQMHASGALTQAEFKAAKKKILGE